jgi:hypothetical protein
LPDDATLAQYLDANRDKYLEPPHLTFTHVYFAFALAFQKRVIRGFAAKESSEMAGIRRKMGRDMGRVAHVIPPHSLIRSTLLI